MRRIKRVFNIASSAVVAFSSILTVGFTGVAHAATYTCTWTGGGSDSNFSTAANWSGCNSAAPQAGDSNDFVFDNTSLSADATLNNDVTGLTANSITFSGSGSHNFKINGSALTLVGNVTISSAQVAEIVTPLTLNGSVNISTVANSELYLGGIIGGNGALTKAGTGSIALGNTNTYTGNFTANAGSVYAFDSAAFGAAANLVTINDGADLTLNAAEAATFANSFTFTGASSAPSGTYPLAKLSLGGGMGGGGGTDETYGAFTTNQSFTLSGTITLGSDVTFGALAQTTTITGPMSGAHKFTMPSNWAGQLVVNSSNNTSDMANGTYTPDAVTQTLSDDQAAHTVMILGNAVITIDGRRGDTTVAKGGKLMGSGTVGALNVSGGGTVAPGHSPGCLTSSNLALSGTLEEQIGGVDPCTGYDQLKVTGTVDVTNGTLDVTRYNDFKGFKAGQEFVIISNDGTDAVTGTFTGLDEGATFKLDNGTVLGISYKGGDGNDVVLTVKSVPNTPDTGFALMSANPAVTLGAAVVAAGTILGIAQKSRKISARR